MRRAAIYQGEIEVLPATDATLTLVDHLSARVQAVFGDVPMRRARPELSNDEFFRRFSIARQGVPRDEGVRSLARAALRSLGVDLTESLMDSPRVRAVPTDGHAIPEAKAAYGLHRDTWYANPQAQINHWIPLFDVTWEESFGIYPELFSVPVANSSDRFDYEDWARVGGFQAYNQVRVTEQHHPVPVAPPPPAASTRFEIRRGDVVRFSAAHLHGPMPHASGLTRYSVELRAVHRGDHARGIGAPNIDNLARGDASRDYLSAADP